MKTGRVRMILGRLREAALPNGGGLSDGQLLGQFVARRDDAAFAALVRRHGPMVLAVCRRVLRHAQDAEDAFQAAFLVLAKKAGAVADREAVAGWLHGVAYRAALGARAAALRRQAKERQVEVMPHPVAPPPDDQRELLELLDRELARLPEKYRLPVVLCELEGRSRKEAARQLGLPEGTLSSRLATARKTLAARLSHGGAAVSAVALGTLFTEGARAACVHGRLVVSTVRAVGGVVPAGVAALTEGVMKSMLLTKLKATAWGLLLAASLSVGAVALTYRPAAAQQPAAVPPPAAAKSSPDRDELEALRLEVEALRLELKATKERVKTLEEQAQAVGREGQLLFTTDHIVVDNPSIARWRAVWAAHADRWDLAQLVQSTAPPEDMQKLAAEVEAAAKKLREKPDDPQALEELNCAVGRLKKAKEQKRDP